MKTQNLLITEHLWGVLTLILCACCFISCSNKEEEGRKVTDYKELVLTIASKKVPGMVWHSGTNYVTEVYAVKKGETEEWITYGSIAGFEYEKGYEYKIKVSETTYQDYAMGDPTWTERNLLEVISKVKKDSEDLPIHLVPDTYYKRIPFTQYRYVVEAFEYEKGYEYKIKVSETTYQDYAMGDPTWTERNLLEVISKVKKDSEDLPIHLVPDTYYKRIPFTQYRYVVEAENKSLIEDDLKMNTLLPLDYHFLYYNSTGGFLKWIGIHDKSRVFGPYIVKNAHKNPEEMPESYKLLPPEGRIVAGSNEWTFLDESEHPVNPLTFDVFIGYTALTKSAGPTPNTIFLYKDLSQFYQSKYPDAGVKTVVISYTLQNPATIR